MVSERIASSGRRVAGWKPGTAGALLLAFQAGPVEAAWRQHVTFTLSVRARLEGVDYFAPPPGVVQADAPTYGFFGNQLRAGVRATYSRFQLGLELQDTRLVSLPDDASLGPPFGNLGPGAVYFAHTPRSNQGELFVKQANLTYRQGGLALTAGRFDYADGLETLPSDPSLGWLKRFRLGERLVGPFGYTHVTRSFDGARLAYDRPGWNATAFASRPTQGGFEVKANPELDDVDLAGLAFTRKGLRKLPLSELRVFYIYLKDGRTGAVKVDNRPLAARRADLDPIRVHSFGMHAAGTRALGPGKLDALAWGVLQTGDWGLLSHSGSAFALEAGYQWPQVRWSPWLRLGYDRSSGDSNPGDPDHDTFYQLLPTARLYAQFPFYNLMNNEDLFAQIVLKPHARVSVRSDAHRLQLGNAADLWYGGGGATNNRVFGFSGNASGGRRSLARLLDVGVTWNLHKRVTAYGYCAHVFGGRVVRQTFAEPSANFGYLELSFRY